MCISQSLINPTQAAIRSAHIISVHLPYLYLGMLINNKIIVNLRISSSGVVGVLVDVVISVKGV